MSDTLDVRIAHLEGAYQQVDKRLGGVESALIHLRADVNSSFAQLRAETNQLRGETNQLRSESTARMDTLAARMDSQFHWLLGTILTSWVTLLLAIVFRH